MRLRPATDDDDPFCLEVNELALREYVEPVYGWDPALQRTYHARWFDPDRLSIIEDDEGRAVGVLDVSDEGDHVYLARIAILPQAQGRGIGTEVVRGVLSRGLPVRLHVFTNNLRAQRFYARLGFRIVDQDVREHHVSMLHDAPEP